MRIRYINTDLDLRSKEDLRPLARALERKGMYSLYVGKDSKYGWAACLEVDAQARAPNGHIVRILKMVESLQGRPRTLWDNCKERELNIGYDSGVKPLNCTHGIPARTLNRMAAEGISLRITIYKIDTEVD